MNETVDSIAMELQAGHRGHPMTTFTGVEFWPMDPQANDINIEDIAHHLAMQCRYNGAIRGFYSVAEHCVIGSYLVPEEFALEFLLHDAAEAYIGDMIRPIKNGSACGGEFKKVEHRVEAAVRERWNLLDPTPDVVKQVDREMCVVEQRQRYPGRPGFVSAAFPDGITEDSVMMVHPETKLHFWDWQTAKQMFLLRFLDLTGERV